MNGLQTKENIKNYIKELVRKVDYEPLSFSDFLSILNCEEETLQNALDELLAEYEIFLSKKKTKYLSFRNINKYKGYISIKNDDYGFVTNEFYPDFYCNSNDFNQAMDKDYVLYSVWDDPYKASGFLAKVEKIIKRHYEYLVGELFFKDNNYYLNCNEKNLYKQILITNNNKAKTKDIVRIKITTYGYILKGEVIDILGNSSEIGMDITLIAAKYNVNRTFTKELQNEVEAISSDLTEERKRRKYYDKLIFTIDGDDAKDLDDAVSIEKLENGNYLLGVYIADVSYYVKEETLLNEEALTRGTSVYLVDRVIPMLPVRLSNDLCSLNPNEDKLVISCIMELDNKGNVLSTSIEEGIINTTKRLSYSKCNDVLENGLINNPDYDIVVKPIKQMVELAKILEEKRYRRGSLDFDTLEPNIILNANGEAIDIQIKARGISEKIIEEFMICANEAIAEFITNMDLPFIYRVHDKPDNIKYQMLRTMVNKLGYKLNGIYPKELQKLLDSLDDKDTYIKNSILRLMSKAIYSDENIGHFGLASRNYTHFTSPIRRYPDLLVHRLLRKYIFNNDNLLNEEEYSLLKQKIKEIAIISSDAEKRAMECEFAVDDMKKAEYMSSYIGTTYNALVTTILKFGIFATLPNTVDGLIRADNLSNYGFTYNDERKCYINYRTNKKISLGEEIKVKLVNASKKNSEIDFELVYNGNSGVRNYGRYKNHRKK